MVVAVISMVTLMVIILMILRMMMLMMLVVTMLMKVRTMWGTGGFAASSQRSIETDRSSQGCSGLLFGIFIFSLLPLCTFIA